MDERRELPAGTPGYESTDVDPKQVSVIGLAILLAIGAAGLGGSLFLYWIFEGREPVAAPASGPSRISEAPSPSPAPRLQAYPTLDLERMRAQEDAALAAYGWVDRQAGVARIPIDRAVDILVARGFPPARVSPGPPPTPAAAPAAAPKPAERGRAR